MPKSLFSYVVMSLVLTACSSAQKNAFPPPKDPPKAEAKIVRDELKGGLSSLKDRKIGALVIFNLPDGYMIRAKTKINPPDIVIKELTEIQTDRIGWLNEALVVNCEKCGDIDIEPPLKALPEDLLLRLIDRTTLKQKISDADWADVAKAWPGHDVLWLILGSEDYEQKRGPSREKGLVSSWAQSTVTVRSFIRDLKSNKLLHEAGIEGHDEDLLLYQAVVEPESGQLMQAPLVPFKNDNIAKWEPAGSSLDSSKYDDVYPYPPIPESPVIVQKTLLRLTETLAP